MQLYTWLNVFLSRYMYACINTVSHKYHHKTQNQSHIDLYMHVHTYQINTIIS